MKEYYVGMDVHQASIVICVMKAAGKAVIESIIETKAQTVRDFIKGPHTILVQTSQHLWLVLSHGVYQQFTSVHHTARP